MKVARELGSERRETVIIQQVLNELYMVNFSKENLHNREYKQF